MSEGAQPVVTHSTPVAAVARPPEIPSEVRENIPSLAALPATVGRGVCIWLTSAHPPLLEEIGPALCDRLQAQRREVELLPSADPADGPPHRLDPLDTVGLLADQAATLLRHGVIVVVAHPLDGTSDRTLARDRIERMVEVFIRSSPSPLRGPEGIPVIYRWMSNGQLEEREVAGPSLEPPDRPDVIVDGTLGPPADVAGDILDVLERAGWIQDLLGVPGEPPGPATTAPAGVPLAAAPVRQRPP